MFFFLRRTQEIRKEKAESKERIKRKKICIEEGEKNGVKQIKRVSGERVGTCFEQHFIFERGMELDLPGPQLQTEDAILAFVPVPTNIEVLDAADSTQLPPQRLWLNWWHG